MKFNVTDILKTANRSLSMTKLKIAKHSPEILLVAGVVGTVASAVLACHETTKISKILDDAGATVDAIHDCIEHPERAENYTAEDGQKDLLITYTQTSVKLVKLYAPSVILGGLSIAAILASNNILRKRNVALAAAFASVSESFDAYRGRVIEKYGKDVDTQLRMGVSEQVVQRTVTDDMGNEKQVDEIVKVCNPMGSPYAVLFDECNPNWQHQPEYNLMFLKAQQQMANDRLRANGFLTLNDVLDSIGCKPTNAGLVVGWVYKKDNDAGDDFVDFGLDDSRENVRDFINGDEPSVWLDFNVQGSIMNLID